VHKRGAHAVAIRRNAVREGGQRVLSSRGDPGVELVYRTGANHGVEAIEQVACGDQRRHTLLDESHGRSEGDGDAIALGRQKSSDHPCRWWFSRSPIRRTVILARPSRRTISLIDVPTRAKARTASVISFRLR